MISFPFKPNPSGPFTFQPTLDGRNCSAEVIWSVFGKRWYLRLFDFDGTLLAFTAVVGSSEFQVVEGLAWDQLRGKVIVTTGEHGLALGTQRVFTIRGASPDAFNGTFLMTVETPTTLSYAKTDDPGSLVKTGVWGREIDLVAGYFTTSRLVYREAAKRFEVF